MEGYFKYYRMNRGYVLPSFEECSKNLEELEATIESACKIIDRLPDYYLLAPLVHLAPDGWFRRCDGVWLYYEDPLTYQLVYNASFSAFFGGYPIPYELFLSRYANNSEQAVFSLGQALATGAVGEYKPSELGYVPSKHRKTEMRKNNGCENIYCGDLALWEYIDNFNIDHMTISHLFRPITGEDIDEMPVINYIEMKCKEMGAKTLLGREYKEIANDLAYKIENGTYSFLDVKPVYFTRV